MGDCWDGNAQSAWGRLAAGVGEGLPRMAPISGSLDGAGGPARMAEISSGGDDIALGLQIGNHLALRLASMAGHVLAHLRHRDRLAAGWGASTYLWRAQAGDLAQALLE